MKIQIKYSNGRNDFAVSAACPFFVPQRFASEGEKTKTRSERAQRAALKPRRHNSLSPPLVARRERHDSSAERKKRRKKPSTSDVVRDECLNVVPLFVGLRQNTPFHFKTIYTLNMYTDSSTRFPVHSTTKQNEANTEKEEDEGEKIARNRRCSQRNANKNRIAGAIAFS